MLLQILMRDNPLTRPGLTLVQSLLFWESAAHHFLALPTIMMSALPIIYMFTQVGSCLHAAQPVTHPVHGMLRNSSHPCALMPGVPACADQPLVAVTAPMEVSYGPVT
jgi:hypothetical protein